MTEKDHRGEVKKHQSHKPGCIVRCESKYDKGNACSHRWQAGQQARGEGRVPYTNYKLHRAAQKTPIHKDTFNKLTAWAGKCWPGLGDQVLYKALPFRVKWWPFAHNCHHIIPVGVLWDAMDETAALASGKEGKMLDETIRTLLDEPYNLNHQVNMIVLPTGVSYAKVLGLPLHTKGGQASHPDYQRQIEMLVHPKFPPKFNGLVSAVMKEKHPEEEERPQVRAWLESNSKAVYEAIISIAVANQGLETLDSVSEEIANLASSTLAG